MTQGKKLYGRGKLLISQTKIYSFLGCIVGDWLKKLTELNIW